MAWARAGPPAPGPLLVLGGLYGLGATSEKEDAAKGKGRGVPDTHIHPADPAVCIPQLRRRRRDNMAHPAGPQATRLAGQTRSC